MLLAVMVASAAPIHDAAKKGDVGEVRRLLDEGADVNIKNDGGSTPLESAMLADKGYNIEVVKLLLEHGADVNIRDMWGGTAFSCCLRNPGAVQREVFDLLIQKGAIVDNRKDGGGYSLTDFAVMGGNIGVLKELIAKGAKLDIQKSVTTAAQRSSREMLEYILNAGGDPNAKNEYGTSALILCFSEDGREHIEKAKLLVERGANVNARAKDGRTALLTAIANFSATEEMVRVLLERGADVNLADSERWTPLTRAVIFNMPAQVPIVKMLLEKGADIDAKIPIGPEKLRLTLIGKVENLGNPEIQELLKAARVDLKYCLKKDDFDADATDALISSKNEFLPKFLSTATNEQKVAMLTAVEKQIAKAKVRAGNLNEKGRAALTKGQAANAADSREHALQVRAYLDVLKEIKTILEGS